MFPLLFCSLVSLTIIIERFIYSKSFNLTPKELKIAYLIKGGMTTKEIAQILSISVNAVNF